MPELTSSQIAHWQSPYTRGQSRRLSRAAILLALRSNLERTTRLLRSTLFSLGKSPALITQIVDGFVQLEASGKKAKAIVSPESIRVNPPAHNTRSITKQPPYCSYRPPRRPSENDGEYYRRVGPGRRCSCEMPHRIIRPWQWMTTPAEEEEWDYNLASGGHAERARKVAFVDPVVSEVRSFERWYEEAYGVVEMSDDFSTEAEDAE